MPNDGNHSAKGDDIADRLLNFAARVGKVVDSLPDTRLGRHIPGQLVRCATSPAANYEEGRVAESRGDFVHKLSIALKELRESRVWLRMIVRAELLSDERFSHLLNECEPLCKIIGKSRPTAKTNASRRLPEQ